MKSLKIAKIDNPLFLKIVDSDKIMLAVGTIESICKNMSIPVPVLDSALPTVLKHKFNFSSVSSVSKEEFERFLRRVNDSNSNVRVI